MRALALARQGWKQRDIAAALDASETAVSRWLAAARRGGPETLRSHPAPGPVAKLTPEQLGLIPDFLWHGPESYGFRGDVWTCERVAGVIYQEFGVSYSKSQVSRCSSTWDGLRRSRSPGRSSGTKKPSSGGGSNRGQF